MISFIIPITAESIGGAIQPLNSVEVSPGDEIIIALTDARVATGLNVRREGVDVRVVHVPYSPTANEQSIREAVKAAKNGWCFLLHPAEQIAQRDHPASVWAHQKYYSQNPRLELGLTDSVKRLPNTVDAVNFPIVWSEDNTAHRAFAHDLCCRLIRKSTPFEWDGMSFVPQSSIEKVFAPHLPILRQPLAMFLLETGDCETALRLTSYTEKMDVGMHREKARFDKRAFIRARAELDKKKAIDSLWGLFEHMSLHEELSRLGVILKNLPYTVENDPAVAEIKRLYAVQMNHLDKGEADWYANGALAVVINESYVVTPETSTNSRARWLMDECRKRGFKRVVEFGALDGCNLFPLTQLAPEIEWHGVDINSASVASAKRLSESTGVKINIHNASFGEFSKRIVDHGEQLFDAAAIMEVLEHNGEDAGMDLLADVERAVKPGGRVFITTPNGAWSLHEPRTRSLTIPKEHIFCYTPERMRNLLDRREAKDIEIGVIENPGYWEANSQVFASYIPKDREKATP